VAEEALYGGDAALLRRQLGAVPSSHWRVYEPRRKARDCEAGVQTRLDDGVCSERGFGEAIPARAVAAPELTLTMRPRFASMRGRNASVTRLTPYKLVSRMPSGALGAPG